MPQLLWEFTLFNLVNHCDLPSAYLKYSRFGRLRMALHDGSWSVYQPASCFDHQLRCVGSFPAGITHIRRATCAEGQVVDPIPRDVGRDIDRRPGVGTERAGRTPRACRVWRVAVVDRAFRPGI